MSSQEELSTFLSKMSIAERLQRHEQDDGTELSTELTAVLTGAVHDNDSPYSLKDVVHALATSATASELDALHVVPLLLDCERPEAGEILYLLAECGNAKETVISVQESFEKLYIELLSDEQPEEDKVATILKRLLRLYIGAIPRLKLRSRSASETVKPLLSNIAPTIERASPSLETADGQTIIQLICNLLSCVTSWAMRQDNEADLFAVKGLCRDILDSTLADLSPFLQTHLTQQKFEECNPRLVRRTSNHGNLEDSALLQVCFDTAISLSITIDILLQERSIGSLVLLSLLLSRSTSSVPPPNSILTAIFPTLIASLQSDTCTDDTLHILLHILHPSSRNTPTSLDPDLIAPLSAALAPLASTSPDPERRLIAFRTLGTLLTRAPPLECMSILRELLTESPFPALRVAAVGLLKDAVLEALAAGPDAAPSPFASRDMLRTFGYIVLRPDPPDLFTRPADRAALQSFVETQEPRRLVECLAFYYVLLMRDVRNITGVREPSQVKSVEKEFLSPLRDTLHTWVGMEDMQTLDEHASMAVAALVTSLDRIDEAYEKLSIRTS